MMSRSLWGDSGCFWLVRSLTFCGLDRYTYGVRASLLPEKEHGRGLEKSTYLRCGRVGPSQMTREGGKPVARRGRKVTDPR